MKVVILAGGMGTRLTEETGVRPKPMVEIGGMPILWHIMKIYSSFGLNDFVICLGYKGYIIKEYFANYFLHMSDVTFDMSQNKMQVHQNKAEPWHVTLVETGEKTMTGGRLRKALPYLKDEEFCLTYGDGVADIDIGKLLAHHRQQQRQATITATRPPGRFGVIDLDGHRVRGFREKPDGDGAWINAGFFVLTPEVFNHLDDDLTIWEKTPLETLAAQDQLSVFKHEGFWQPMDTLRDKNYLEELWLGGHPPWKVW